jgi:hypothetical protein
VNLEPGALLGEIESVRARVAFPIAAGVKPTASANALASEKSTAMALLFRIGSSRWAARTADA